MARVRRRSTTTVRWNFEIAGIAALGLALLLGLALVLSPARSGIVGVATAHALRSLFGSAAGLVPLLIALVGAIIFLEINVPRMIATLGSAALGFFLIVDTAYGRFGGIVGSSLDRGLRALVGDAGTIIVLVVIALGITVWITNVSVKKVIGWCIARLAALRPPPRPKTARAAAAPAVPGPANLREAFHLPALAPRAKAASTALAVAEPLAPPKRPAKLVYDEPPAVIEDDDVLDEDEEELVDPLDGDETDAGYDDDEDDEYDDDEDDELEVAGEDDDDDDDDVAEIVTPAAGAVVVGEYEPAPPVLRAVQDDTARTYRLPDLNLFDPPQAQKVDDSSRATVLEDTLASFGVGAKVTHIERGPSITRYELKPERGVKISRISALADDLALALAATSVRIEAPIPGKSAVGIEVPNATVSIVAIREIMDAMPNRGTIPPLNMALGKDITGRAVFGDLGKMPHLLVAGATGSGKSVCLNGIIASLLVSATPDQVQMLFIDPKRVELTVYNGIPHLIKDVITDARMAAGALFEMTKEMDQRYEKFAKAGVRKIEEYNAKFPDEKLPYVVIVIDELADLMLIAPAKVETTICRLAQLARATGMHLIVATQRPSVDVITGIIKANIPSRIAFAVSSQVDSRTILDMAGAERLLGRGDMLYLPIDAPKPVRAQGALVTSAEISRLVEFWAAQARPDNLLDVEVAPIEDDDGDKKSIDPLCYDAARFIIETNYASTAQLQSQFSIGHPRAVRLMKQLEDFKVVGPHEGTKPRKILLGLGDLETIAPRLGRSQQELFG
jgi:S-DNA-T family DNA segregation ATPase FtsK/SpoIIIE